MTDEQTTDEPVKGPNLMLLRGIVIGLGLLLLLGTALVGVKMSQVASKAKEAETARTVSATAPANLASLPPIPIHEGETIASVSAGDGLIFVLLERSQAGTAVKQRRIVALDRQQPEIWLELATE